MGNWWESLPSTAGIRRRSIFSFSIREGEDFSPPGFTHFHCTFLMLWFN